MMAGALLILVIGAAVALVGGTPTNGVGIIAPSASPALPSSRPGSTPTMPAVPTATPIATPSPGPTEIVARRILIPRLGIDLRIIEGDGVDAPMDKAAHYPGSAWPDGGSNIYIYAHAQTGMFLTLWDAKVGDEVVLELVDRTSRRYLVTEVKPRVRWNAMEYLDPTSTEQLTLQTSTSYTATAPRFIVIAEPAG
jgi:LPXTG-site transpeptidase (sortase) family protein